MGSSNFRNAIGAVKDQTSITLAKVASFSHLRVAIVKATSHKACPAKEHHIREILTLTSYSRQHAASCIATISKRLNKTKDWVVALKSLILIQRLMQQGNPAFEQEVFYTTKNGTHILDMSHFRDMAWSNSWDFSGFVRAYALHLRDQLDSRMHDKEQRCGMFRYAEDEDEPLSPRAIVVRTIPIREMENDQIYLRAQLLMKLLGSFLACKPTGASKNNRIVAIALYPIVKQSFHLYYEITEIVSILLDRFEKLDVVESTKVFEILSHVAKQYEELDTFYYWCNEACITRTCDYPNVNKITQKKLDLMDECIKDKIEREQHEPIHEPEPEPKCEAKPEPDLISIEPLPTTKGFEHEKKETKSQDIGDLLSFEDDAPTTQQHSDQLALALFGSMATSLEKTGTQPWEAFDESSDWETALVQTASHLSKQKPSLPGGFDTLLLDGMYQQGAMANSSMMNTGSASSMAYGPTGWPTPLALPPPFSSNGTSPGGDPFAASLVVAPPSYVQMSDIERKQRLLMEEQIMWQQYQGQIGMANMYMNQYPYNYGGYTYQC